LDSKDSEGGAIVEIEVKFEFVEKWGCGVWNESKTARFAKLFIALKYLCVALISHK